MVSESKDKGLTWSMVRDSELPNEGSGADVVTLENGNWVLAYNDTEDGRHSLAISLTTDEGRSWNHTRHLELDKREPNVATQFAYPSIIEGRNGEIHVVYSLHRRDAERGPNKTIKYARITEDWIREGD
jgi:predicted neuraminidase